MPYQPNIPLAVDLISKSQADINANFQALNPMYLGINNYIMFPEQGVAPAVAATNLALYTKHVGADTAMFIKDSAGVETDFTTAGKATDGWCQLPCGILMKWFHVPAVTNHTVYNYPVAAGIPLFNAVYHAQVTTERTGVALSYPVCFEAFTTTTITLATKNGAGDSGAYIFITGAPV